MKSERNLKFSGYAILFLVVFLLTWLGTAHCQVPVAIAPEVFPIYFGSLGPNTGLPLAGGFLYTYQAGTTTRLDSYVDSTGVVTNTWPIPLDAAGAPSNGSAETGVWLANASYKFCAYSSALVLQWCRDNIASYFQLLNQANLWTFQQSFSQPIVDTQTDNQMVFGSPGNQTTADFPPPTGNVTLHFPSTTDTVVGRATTDTLTNKTLNLPQFNGSACPIVNGPGTYVCIANANPTGTTINLLAMLANAPSQATVPATTTLLGIVGICVASCGNTGTATIQVSGVASCVFSNATTAGDYVIPSASTPGDCSDNGTNPVAQQTVGRVLSTNGGAGTYSILLTPAPTSIVSGVQNLGNATVNAGTCTSVASTANGAVGGSTVAWAYNNSGGGPTSTDLKLIVSPQSATNSITWNICNPGAGNLTQSGNASVSWRVIP